jgi:hypothetical protein
MNENFLINHRLQAIRLSSKEYHRGVNQPTGAIIQ